MLKLESIIARFVDDVLEAVRSASLAEVEEALSPAGSSPAPAVGDMTDPAALLEAAVAAYGAPAAYEWLLTAGNDDAGPPESTVRPAAAPHGSHAAGSHAHVSSASASRARSRA